VAVKERIGAVPFLIKGDQVIVLLVTSMSRARWIFPKGLPEGDETPEETARREAMEEAGVEGRTLGAYPIDAVVQKSDDHGKVEVPVTFYPLEVETIAEKWPEKGKRLRHWVVLEDAQDIARDADTQKVLVSFREAVRMIRNAR